MKPIAAGMIVTVSFLGGCALNPPPHDELAAARAALDKARAAGAGEHAPEELRLATDKLALGQRWMAAMDHKPARWLVQQAQVDAELAAMKSASARARVSARAATDEFRALNAVSLRVTN